MSKFMILCNDWMYLGLNSVNVIIMIKHLRDEDYYLNKIFKYDCGNEYNARLQKISLF
jgi:hypothetical protein